MADTTIHHAGSCHCGAVRFEVEGDLSEPVRCNCSFCVRRGALLQKVPSTKFNLVAGDEALSYYGNRDFSDHYFCKICGIHTHTRSTRNGEDSVVVNLLCIPGINLEGIEPRVFDGANRL